jgi:hypothetical protein
VPGLAPGPGRGSTFSIQDLTLRIPDGKTLVNPGAERLRQDHAPPDQRLIVIIHPPSCRHPEDPGAPGPLPFGAEPRARVLIQSSRAAVDTVASAPRGVTGADAALAMYSTCPLTAKVCPRSIALSLGGAAGRARRLVMCAVAAAPAGVQRAQVGGGRQGRGALGGGARVEGCRCYLRSVRRRAFGSPSATVVSWRRPPPWCEATPPTAAR